MASDRAPDLPALPRDEAGSPVFREPWEAQAFAMAVRLHEAGTSRGASGPTGSPRRSSARRPPVILGLMMGTTGDHWPRRPARIPRLTYVR
jgi:hypothetical protein